MKLATTLMGIAIAGSCYGASRYVRSTSACSYNGNGSAPTCATSAGGAGAWRGFANISWSSMVAGDTLYLVSGDTYTEKMTIGKGGSSSTNPITISVYGGGTATVDAAGLTGPIFNFSGNQFVTINGVIGDATSGNTTYGLRVINIASSSSTNTFCAYENSAGGNIKLLHVECAGTAATTEPDDNGGGYYFQSGSVGGVEAGYNWFHGPSPSVKWYGTCGTVFSNTGSTSYTDNLVHDNLCENMYNDGFRGSSNISIYRNIVKHIDKSGHSDSLLCQSGKYCAIFSNYVEGSGDQNIYLDNLYDSPCGPIRVYNNVINSDPGFGIIIDPEGGAGAGCGGSATGSTWNDVVIANNTFYSTSAAQVRWSRRGSITNLVVVNNIFGRNSDNSYPAVDLNTGASFVDATAWDYNTYSDKGAQYPTLANYSGYKTLAQLRSLSPQREGNAVIGSPAYVNAAGLDFRLASTDTLAAGNGVNLAARFPFLATDKSGLARPADQRGAWDRGAFQRAGVGSTLPLQPPTVITSTVK